MLNNMWNHFKGRMQDQGGWIPAAIGAVAGLAGSILGARDSQRSAEASAQRIGAAANVPIDKNAFNINNVQQQSQLAGQRSASAVQQADVANQQRQALIGQLQAQASGQGPSLATAQLKASQDRTLAQQLAAAASRPQNATALGSRTLMRQQGEAGAQLAQQANQAQIQEALNAQQLLSQNVNQSEQLGSQLALQYMQQGFSMDQAQQQAQQALQQLRVQQALGVGGIQADVYKNALDTNQKNLAGMIKGVSGAASGIAGGIGGLLSAPAKLPDLGGTVDPSLANIGSTR